LKKKGGKLENEKKIISPFPKKKKKKKEIEE